MVRWPVVGLLVLVALSGAAPQGGKKRQKQASSGRGSTTTSTTAAPEPVYWWLEGEVSPFGGRNYNIQEAGDRVPGSSLDLKKALAFIPEGRFHPVGCSPCDLPV